jgi:hypothetical protein
MNFTAVEKIANAILYEGYILYPYRPTAIKNRQRWNFGTLYPRVYAEAQRPHEPFRLIAEFLLIAQHNAKLDVKSSFLQLVRQAPAAERDAIHTLTDASLDCDQAIERTEEIGDISINALMHAPMVHWFTPAPEIQAKLTISAETLPTGVCRVHLELENGSPLLRGAAIKRDEALPRSLVSAHVLLGILDGEFVSLLEPPERFCDDAKACTNTGVFPVLVGQEPDRSMMLVSPIILYDYPQIAPESAGDFFDGTEMDEMLTLRVLTLTDEEKAEMRAGDPQARRILERTEAITNQEMLQVHGIIREIRNSNLLEPDTRKDRQ